MTQENISDAISKNIPICTKQIQFVTDHKVS